MFVVLWYRDRVIQWYWYSFLHRCFHIDTLRYVSLLHDKFPCCHAIPCVLRNRRPPTPRPYQPPTMAAAPLTLARPSRQWFLRESWDHLEWQRWVLRVRVRVRVRGRSDIVYIYMALTYPERHTDSFQCNCSLQGATCCLPNLNWPSLAELGFYCILHALICPQHAQNRFIRSIYFIYTDRTKIRQVWEWFSVGIT